MLGIEVQAAAEEVDGGLEVVLVAVAACFSLDGHDLAVESFGHAIRNGVEAVGQDVADRIILESHFQLDGFTTFTRAARAIVDADQNLFKGKYKKILQAVFRRRKIKLK